MTIRRKTRKDLLDWLSVDDAHWSGRLEEDKFLARLYDLEALPSTDRRYDDAAGDIWQHRVNNANDWPDDWVFGDDRFNLLGCSDEAFLAEVVSPVVRPDADEAKRPAEVFNDILREDGWELAVKSKVAGKPTWIGKPLRAAPTSVRIAREKFDDAYIRKQIKRMEDSVEDDPGLAIGTAKELIETACRAILEQRGVEPPPGKPDLPKLVRAVAEELNLVPERVAPTAPDPESIKRILGSLASVATGIAELRNAYGTGHGRSPKARGLGPRHARLAVGAASTLVVFLFDTHEERPVKESR